MTASKRWRGRGRTAFLTVLAAAALWMAEKPAASGRAADKTDEASDLDVIPSEGEVILSLHLAELWNDQAFKTAREKILKDAPLLSDVVVQKVGAAPDEIERLTGLMPSVSSNGGWLFFITTTKTYDPKKVLAALAPDAAEEKVKGHAFHANSKGSSIAFLTDRTYAFGSAEEVKRFLNRGAETKEGPLTPALQAARKHLIVWGVDVPRFAEKMPKEWPPHVLSALFTCDWGKELKADGKLTFAGESDAKAGEQAANAEVALFRNGVKEVRAYVVRGYHQDPVDPVIEHLQRLEEGLKSVQFERSGSVLEASLTAKVDLTKALPELVGWMELVWIPNVCDSRGFSAGNLRLLALAMYDYKAVYSRFPAAAVYDKNGKPLLSWRVLVLPYIGQEALYKEFHLDEPWDSDHNKKLLKKMPPLFAAGLDDEQSLKNHETHYQGFTGKGAFFDGEKGARAADFANDNSQTIMLVEAKKAVPWTKPEDLPFDAGKLVPKLGLFKGIFNAAFADGSVHSLPLTIKEEKLRALVTRNGGEVIETDK